MSESRATVLAVDDAKSNIDILLSILKDYDVMVALDGPSALEIMEQESPDIILLDIMMPDMDGYEVCTAIKAREEWRDIPILFITARTDEASIVRAFDMGGSDYVTKPFRARELLARVRIQLEYRQAMERLRYLAVTDELTGIPNRRAFFSRGTALFDGARRRGEPLCAMMLDLDYFKTINDDYGHAVGDLALQRFTDDVQSGLQEGDLFGRLGGEEFAVIPPGRDLHSAVALAETIRSTVGRIRLETGSGELSMTVSIGVAQADPDTRNLDALLFAADNQLYRAKNGEKNCTCYPGCACRVPGKKLRMPPR